MSKYNYDKAKSALAQLPYGADLLVKLALGRERFAPLLDWYVATPAEMREVAAPGVASKLAQELGGTSEFWLDALSDVAPQDIPSLVGAAIVHNAPVPKPLDIDIANDLLAMRRMVRDIFGKEPLEDVAAAIASHGVKADRTLVSKLRNLNPDSAAKLSMSRARVDGLLAAIKAEKAARQAQPTQAIQPVPATQPAPLAPAKPAAEAKLAAPAKPAAPAPLPTISDLPLQRMKIREMFEASPSGRITSTEVARTLGLPNVAAAIAALAEVRGARHLGNQQYELSL